MFDAAQRSKVPFGDTIAAIESGRRDTTVATFVRLIEAALAISHPLRRSYAPPRRRNKSRSTPIWVPWWLISFSVDATTCAPVPIGPGPP